ncbi:DUF1631 family protein [Pseudoluteimonas lycopersici]|nr:DUF1631 family protein [Lysobacter lycopersici]
MMLAALQEQLLEILLPALERALGDSAQGRFDHARIVQSVRQALAAGFRELPRSKPASEAIDTADVNLSLLSEDALETQLARDQVVDGMSRANARSLDMLGKRLAHTAGRGDLRESDNPMSPAFIVQALVAALEEADPDPRHRIATLRAAEGPLAGALAQAYQRSEAMLASGELPQVARPAARPPLPPTGRASPGPASAGGTGMPVDGMLFTHLFKLLESRRAPVREEQPLFDPGTVTPTVPRIGSNELLSILALMQHELSDPAAAQAAGPGSLAERLQRELAANARKLGMGGDRLSLGETDEETLGMMARLFDSLLENARFDNRSRRKIDRMLVPFARVAVRDRYMFDTREHPAWRLLNTIAEACSGNNGDGPQERELLDHVDHTIDRLVAEFNEDIAIFETLEQELRAYMGQSRKRLALAEKRAAQARHGRERLESARKAATEELRQRRADRELPPAVGTFLDLHAAHHIAQVILREGHDSPRYAQAMAAVDGLLQAHDRKAQAATGEPPPLPREQLETILASSGYVGESAAAIVDELEDELAPPPAIEAESVPLEADGVEAETQEQGETEAAPRMQVVGGTDTLDFDGDVLERVRNLRVGDWLQLLASSGRMEPAKVSWISPISSRLLLVNRRGVRVLTASTAELAAMVKLGKARFDGA